LTNADGHIILLAINEEQMSDKVRQIIKDVIESGVLGKTEDQLVRIFIAYELKESGKPVSEIAIQNRMSGITQFSKRVMSSVVIIDAVYSFIRRYEHMSEQEMDKIFDFNMDLLSHKFSLPRNSEDLMDIIGTAVNIANGAPLESHCPEINIFKDLDFSCNECTMSSRCKEYGYEISKCYLLDFAEINLGEIESRFDGGIIMMTEKQRKHLKDIINGCRREK
jgi:hypothetical protein